METTSLALSEGEKKLTGTYKAQMLTSYISCKKRGEKTVWKFGGVFMCWTISWTTKKKKERKNKLIDELAVAPRLAYRYKISIYLFMWLTPRKRIGIFSQNVKLLLLMKKNVKTFFSGTLSTFICSGKDYIKLRSIRTDWTTWGIHSFILNNWSGL